MFQTFHRLCEIMVSIPGLFFSLYYETIILLLLFFAVFFRNWKKVNDFGNKIIWSGKKDKKNNLPELKWALRIWPAAIVG